MSMQTIQNSHTIVYSHHDTIHLLNIKLSILHNCSLSPFATR